MLVSVAMLPLFSCHKTSHRSSAEVDSVEVAEALVDSVIIHKTYPGSLSANREVDLVGRVDAELIAMNYQPGDRVSKGQVLYRLDDRTYRDAVVQAEAALATAKASRDYAATHYAAMTEALKGDAVSEMEVEQAKSTLAQSEAAVRNAEATLSTARTQLSYCTVTAPFDGHASVNEYSVGSYVSGAAAPVKLASIYEDDRMIVTFSIDDTAAPELTANIRSGKVNLHDIPLVFDDGLAHSYTANLDYVAPKVNTSTGALELQALIDNPYGELRSGMYVAVNLPVASDPKAILVRDASIASDQLGKYVYLVNDSDRVVYTPIQTGELVADTMRIVNSGIAAGDRYVTKALLKVRDGMNVKPYQSK